MYGCGQSLERLNERAGLSWAELVFHLYNELKRERSVHSTEPRAALMGEEAPHAREV
jgi:hypothetical protein